MTANNKAKTKADEDWFGELLVAAVTLTGKGLFRFALRCPDTATLLAVFAVSAMLAGLRWACVLIVVCAVGVWGWRLGWPEPYQRLIGKPVADYRRAYLVYRRRWRTICEHHGLTISQPGKPDTEPLVPELSAVRIGAAVDTLVVRLLVGQSVKTWQAQVDGLAAAFGAHQLSRSNPAGLRPGGAATSFCGCATTTPWPPRSRWRVRIPTFRCCGWRRCLSESPSTAARGRYRWPAITFWSVGPLARARARCCGHWWPDWRRVSRPG